MIYPLDRCTTISRKRGGFYVRFMARLGYLLATDINVEFFKNFKEE